MRTWPRILMVLGCVSIMMLTEQIVTAQEAECLGGFSDTFQLDGELKLPKTYTLPDLLLQSQNWTRVKDFFQTAVRSPGFCCGICCKRQRSSSIPVGAMISLVNPC